jgi:hypothetical protein
LQTKTKSTVADLESLLVKVQAELAQLRGTQSRVNSEAVASLSAAEWNLIRFNMVVMNNQNKPQLAKNHKGYALVKGADVKLYMATKGFANTLKSQDEKGETVGLKTELNSKGRSQLMYATEVIEALIEGGFVKPDRFIKAKATKKS